MSSHKKYIIGFVVMLGCLGLALLDFKAGHRFEQYNPNGVAHYDLSYDLLLPTPSLINRAFIDAIKRFPRRDTVVFVGNSVIAGAGAEDKVFFNKQIAIKFNVINAGLNGEYFPASLALATLGIKAMAKNQPDSFFHVFIAYPATRLYLFSSSSGYWVMGPALYSLANESGMAGYIFKGDGLTPMGKAIQTLYGIKNYLVMNMRCVIDRRVVMDSLQSLEPYCLKAIDTRINGSRVLPSLTDRATLKFMGSEASRFAESAYREETLTFLDEKVQNLIRFLEENHLKYKMHFLLLGDPPGVVNMLPQAERQRYLEARSDYVDSIRLREPGWGVDAIDSLATSDFHDASHMNENGQLKLALKILDLATGKATQGATSVTGNHP
jgi:hypothetical protein